MRKLLGIFGLLVFVCVFTAIKEPQFLTAYNISNTIRWSSLYAILGIGVAFVIVTSGIDLSIGSVVGVVGSSLALLVAVHGLPVIVALPAVLVFSLLIGLGHGLLVTKMRLQPFIVTLCGLLVFRGLARMVTDDKTVGFGNDFQGLKSFFVGNIPLGGFNLPMPFIIMAVIATLAWVFLNKTIYGRYLLALGRNPEAAKFSGINTDRMVTLAYMICAFLAGLGGIMFSLDLNSVQPSGFGEFYELYAIAAAVLGGCSLRGGEASIIGVVIGAAVLRVIRNAINVLEIDTHYEYAIIGGVILGGVLVDEVVKRIVARRGAVAERAAAETK